MSALPATLAADGKGFTRHLIIHMNFGEDGGAAKYSIHGSDGADLPITYQYDTRKGQAEANGFWINGVETAFTKWADLCAYWPTYIAERAE